MNNPELDFFEVVYYSAPVPNSLAALTMLFFVFDRIHFPAVYVPAKGVIDLTETRKERLRLTQVGRSDTSCGHLVGALWAAENIEYLGEFCSFCGRPGFENLDSETHILALDLEELIFGPRAEGVIPIKHGGKFSKRSSGAKSIPFASFVAFLVRLLRERIDLFGKKSHTSRRGRSQNSSAGPSQLSKEQYQATFHNPYDRVCEASASKGQTVLVQPEMEE